MPIPDWMPESLGTPLGLKPLRAALDLESLHSVWASVARPVPAESVPVADAGA